MPRRIALSWEKNGPNYYAELGEHDLSVCLNDVAQTYHVFVDGKQDSRSFASARAAKSAAERVAYAIYEEVS